LNYGSEQGIQNILSHSALSYVHAEPVEAQLMSQVQEPLALRRGGRWGQGPRGDERSRVDRASRGPPGGDCRRQGQD
jgi:hypothetical protein